MIILGLNAHHPDAAACLLIDGQLVAAIEEERFTRVKHWMGFPTESIRWCLQQAKVKVSAVDHIAVNRRPWANLEICDLWKPINWRKAGLRLAARSLRDDLEQAFDTMVTAKIHHVEHHLAHASSAFFFSPYPSASILTIDGMGDLCSTMMATGQDNRITVLDRIKAPHSLGLLYAAITQYLGFPNYGDEYKVMALAAEGEPRDHPIQKLIRFLPRGRFALNMHYFQHGSASTLLHQRADGLPMIPTLLNEEGKKILEPYPSRTIAASLQAVYQEAVERLMLSIPGVSALCLAGGCAQNSVANGRLLRHYPSIYVPPASADNGGALGAAAYVWCQKLKQPRPAPLTHALYGWRTTRYDDYALAAHTSGMTPEAVAKLLASGKIVGWCQGPMEFGPRALGNRSIFTDPRQARLKDILNEIVKHRESWRPFGMSILAEHVRDYFDCDVDSPFMSFTLPVLAAQRANIPAVCHVDGTSRIHTVTRKQNPLFWQLLMEFYKHTGVPLLLNTSFNDQSPIVRTPAEAFDVFQKTALDALAIGPYLLRK